MTSPNEILKKHVEDVLKQLEKREALRSEVEELKALSSSLETVDFPPIINGVLYYSFNSTLAKLYELKEYLKNKTNDIELYYLLREINSALRFYVGSAKNYHKKEMVQLSLPVYLSIVVYVLSFIAEPVDRNIVTLILGALGVGLTFFNVIGAYATVIIASLVNVIILLGFTGLSSLNSIVIHLLIIISSVTYIYIAFSMRSREYREKLSKLLTDVSNVIERVVEPSDKHEVEKLLNEVIFGNQSGSSRKLISYKASVLIMNGYSLDEVRKIISRYIY
ncbi:MAG: hypothetical protein QXP68_02355 [Thermosphaera sp.]